MRKVSLILGIKKQKRYLWLPSSHPLIIVALNLGFSPMVRRVLQGSNFHLETV